jgi:hypothetical protein
VLIREVSLDGIFIRFHTQNITNIHNTLNNSFNHIVGFNSLF